MYPALIKGFDNLGREIVSIEQYLLPSTNLEEISMKLQDKADLFTPIEKTPTVVRITINCAI